MLNKIMIGACAALVLVCVLLGWRLKVAVEDLTVANVNLAIAEQLVKDMEAEIRINEEVISSLTEARDKLVMERAAAQATIKDLLTQERNAAWGNERLPEDVQKFLQNNLFNDKEENR